MPIRFSPARDRSLAATVRRVRTTVPPAINDNSGGAGVTSVRPAVILPAEALRFFARHGIAAAEHAWDNALRALAAGDTNGAGRWLEICGQFDPKLAGSVPWAERA
jgi:hypothetical protein